MTAPARRVRPRLARLGLAVLLGCGGSDGAASPDAAPPEAAPPAPLAWSTVPAGTYTIGCTPGQQGHCEANEPMRTVTLGRAVAFAVTEVTQAQWAAVMGTNPSAFPTCGPDCPVEQVSWYDAIAYANAASAKDGLEACYLVSGTDVAWPAGPACTGYRLPTDAEWEVAARGGADTLYAGGDDADAVAWHGANTEIALRPVGRLAANGYGLHDMSGNVWEWTWDWYDVAPAGGTDPLGPASGQFRVRRGGCFLCVGAGRVADRFDDVPVDRDGTNGLRLVRTLR